MKVVRIRDVKLPVRGTPGSGGIDFFAPNSGNLFNKINKIVIQNDFIVIKPGESALIPSGIKANIPEGHALIAFNKSGIATKKHLIIGAEFVDEDYMGEMHIHLINVGNKNVIIEAGDKITQFVCMPINYVEIEEVETEEECFADMVSERGEGGFGSTGNK